MDAVSWLLTALPREHSAFRPRKIAQLAPTAWLCAHRDRHFVLAETGMGGQAVERSLDELVRLSSPRSVFLAGFGGALCQTLRVGDAVLATYVINPLGNAHRATLPVSLPYRVGTILTSDRMIGSTDEKRRMSAQAVVVDMESSYMAAWCERRNVPWGCLRVVTDDARTPISQAVFELLEGGEPSIGRVITTLLRKPSILGELLHLARSSRIAARIIADAFELLLNAG